jgi:trk system potassium uptake protein TrkH
MPPESPASPLHAHRSSRSVAFTRGALVAAAPAFVALAEGAPPQSFTSWRGLVALAGAAVFLIAAALIPRTPRGARLLFWLGFAAGAVLGAPLLARSPSLALLALLILIAGSLALGWRPLEATAALAPGVSSTWMVRGCAAASTTLWLVAVAAVGVPAARGALALGASALIASIGIGRWILRLGAQHRTRRALLLVTAISIAAVLPFLAGRLGSIAGALAVFPAVGLLLLPSGPRPADDSIDWLALLFASPQRLLVFTFAVLCLAGTVALALPFSSASGQPLSYVDAFFTAVSAVCITGLTVVDTPVAFSGAGKVVILILIQTGALGIMTFSTAALGLLRRRLSLVHEGAVAGLVSGAERRHVFESVKQILLVTAVAEAAGAVLLWMLFWGEGDRPLQALGRGVFTAISAFGNAGFALQSNNLIPYARNDAILHTVGALIVLGGISPFLVLRVPRVLAGRHARAQEKLILATTALLLITGAVLFALLEWNGSLAGLSVGDKLTNAWFQSVTRTAGFNSVDMGQLSLPTLSFILVLMFVGGSPGSTAGGIKTTTAAVLVLAVLAAVRGHAVAEVFHRRIPHSTVYRAAAIATVGAAAVFTAFMAMLLTQNMPGRVALFEVVSALGTVGLSVGGTLMLDDLGKLAIAGCMFAGRVGPLTLFMFLRSKAVRDGWTRPEEEIAVG